MSDLEKMAEWGAIVFGILLFGSSNEMIIQPIKATFMRGYENLKVAGEKTRKLLYKENSELY